MKKKKKKLNTNIKLIALSILCFLILLSYPKLSSSQISYSANSDSLILLQKDSALLILNALNKGLEYRKLLNSSEVALGQRDSVISSLEALNLSLIRKLESTPLVEYKTNWWITTVVTSAALLINWALYLKFK